MKKIVILMMILLLTASLYSQETTKSFHKTVQYVDMTRFSGDWYVIALIPTSFEKKIIDGIENYSLDAEGNIKVQYTFRKKGRIKKGRRTYKDKVMYQKGWIFNKESNAEWRVQPLWPLKLPYYILELDKEYSYTVIGTNNYKYLWIMSRKPSLDPQLLNAIIDRMVERGFEREKIIMMTQTRGGQ